MSSFRIKTINTNEKSTGRKSWKKISFDIVLPDEFEWDINLESDENAINFLTNKVWPFYLTEKPDIEVTVPYQSFQYQRYQEQRFFSWGIRERHSKQLVAFVSSRCLYSEKEQIVFPQGGWQWSLQAAFEDEQVNTLCLTSVTVDPQYRAIGLAKALVNSAKQQARYLGFHTVLVPVRPTNKVNYPNISMQKYIDGVVNVRAKGKEKGDLFPKDPWVTLHYRLGGTLLNICDQSMVITASVNWWATRLNVSFKGLKQVNIPFGLVPLEVQHERHLAIYTEPNIWMKYTF